MASALERRFDLVWQALGGPDLDREHRFDPDRRWRFDRAWIARKAAIELDGATWSGGRHTRGAGYRDDCEKDNAAVALGWRVFHLTTDMVSIGYIGAMLEAIRFGRGINFRFARKKGGRARRFKLTPKGRLLRCNSLRRSGGAPSSSSP